MCFDLKDPWIMDIKLGTSTLTARGALREAAVAERRAAKDAEYTSAELGFCVIGSKADGKKFSVKAPGVVQPTKETVNDHLKVIFVHEGVVSKPAVHMILMELDLLIEHFENVNTIEIRGASIFIVLDHTMQKWQLRLIDLASFDFKDHKDEGFNLGLREVRARIATFI